MDSVLHNPPARRDEVQAVRKKFISSEGDHLTLLNVYRAFKNVSGNKVGCSEDSRVCAGEEFFWLAAVTSASFQSTCENGDVARALQMGSRGSCSSATGFPRRELVTKVV